MPYICKSKNKMISKSYLNRSVMITSASVLFFTLSIRQMVLPEVTNGKINIRYVQSIIKQCHIPAH